MLDIICECPKELHDLHNQYCLYKKNVDDIEGVLTF